FIYFWARTNLLTPTLKRVFFFKKLDIGGGCFLSSAEIVEEEFSQPWVPNLPGDEPRGFSTTIRYQVLHFPSPPLGFARPFLKRL
ncbi:hypothetical protein, partial [Salmonella enterica]|uniref:hypothetical protein n=1 Tax=Salmonella enterica TaxID=28901 RepID=UPI001EE69D96